MTVIEGGKISAKQAGVLLFITIIPTAAVFLPSLVVLEARQDAWLAMLLATLGGLIFITLFNQLAKRFPQETIFQYATKILGKPLGKVFGLIFIFMLVQTNAIIIREFGEFMNTAVLTQTPLIVLIVTIVGMAAYTVGKGLEVIARMAGIIMFFMVGLALLALLLVFNEAHLVRLLPVFEYGLKPVIRGALGPMAWFSEGFVLTIIYPYVANQKRLFNSSLTGIGSIGVLLALGFMAMVSVFGAPEAGRLMFGNFSLVRIISVQGFLERLETIVIMAWVAGIYLKISLFYYWAVLGTAQYFGLGYYRPLILPMGVILATLSVTMFANITELIEHLTFLPYYFIPLYVVLPLLILVISLLSGKKGADL